MVEGYTRINDKVAIPGPLPVLYIEHRRTLIFADAHLGFEEEMAKHGLFLPRVQKKNLIKILDNILTELNVSEIVVAGDIKHQFGQLGRIEARELRELFDSLKDKIDRLVIVRGNHDNFLPLVTRKYDFVHLVDDYYLIEDILIVHGHKKLSLPEDKNIRLVVMGHEHPSLGLRDKLGYLIKYPCFLRAPLRYQGVEAIVLPAIGVYQTGTTITLDRSSYLSPIIKEDVLLEEAKPIVFDEELGVLEFPELKTLFKSFNEMLV